MCGKLIDKMLIFSIFYLDLSRNIAKMSSQIQAEINKVLHHLSHEIIPSDEYLENGTKAATAVSIYFYLIKFQFKNK